MKKGETVGPLEERKSNRYSAAVVIGLLEWFFSSVGLASIIQNAYANYAASNKKMIQFCFKKVTRDSANVGEAAENLLGCKLKKGSALYSKSRRYYLVTAVYRSPALSINLEEDSIKIFDAIAQALPIRVTQKFKTTASRETEIAFAGKKSLVFAAELHELEYLDRENRFRINAVDKLIELRGGKKQIPDIRKPDLIEDNNGSLFLP